MWSAAVFVDFPNPRYASMHDQVYDPDIGEHLSLIFYQGEKYEAIEFITNKYGAYIINYELYSNKNLMDLWSEIKNDKDKYGKLVSKSVDEVLKACDVRIFRKNELTIKEGFNCKKCNDYYEYARSNQSDGSFLCYGCKLWAYVGRRESD